MLNQSILSSNNIKKASLAFILFALLIGLSCGKRKPPLPPIEKISQRVEISGIQRGNSVMLSLKLPDKNASDNSTLNINRADIYRLAEPIDSPLTLSEEEFASRSVLIFTLPISDSDFARKQINYSDNLELIAQTVRLRYAIRLVNNSGQKAAFSNFLLIQPSLKTARNPNSLSVEVFNNSIKLMWKKPASNIDGSTPANILGYNLYRSENENTGGVKVLNDTPLINENFSDVTFEFGKNYYYFVRTVSLGAEGDVVESINSETIKISPKDIFKPSPPNSITIAAAPNNLSIFFAASGEKDVVGYQIYRTTDSSIPKTNWLLLNKELLTTNTFQDITVESGKTYFYYLIAVDNAGNFSDPSETVSESAP